MGPVLAIIKPVQKEKPQLWRKIYRSVYICSYLSDKMPKSEHTKAFIIEKTAPVFNRKGYAGTSLTDLTQVTKLTKGSIYGNFANKDEVAMAAFEHNVKTVNAILHREMDKQSTAKGKLLAYARVYANFDNYPFPAGGCPVMNTATESDDTHPALSRKAALAINGWRNQLQSILEEGVSKKEFRKQIDPQQVALTMIALIEGGLMISRATKKPAWRIAVMQSLEQLIEQLK